MKAQQEWRVFCAVELPDEVRARLQEHIARLRKVVPDAAASWSRVENIHLTLKFFGNVALDRIPKISAAATRTTEHFSNASSAARNFSSAGVNFGRKTLIASFVKKTPAME